jgi:hypothetical protein
MSELLWDDLRLALNNANFFASSLGLDELSDKVQECIKMYNDEWNKEYSGHSR